MITTRRVLHQCSGYYIPYDFGVRIETGRERSLLLYNSKYNLLEVVNTIFGLTGPHAFGPKKVYFGNKILMKQLHDCSY